jgi:hypothetical protein
MNFSFSSMTGATQVSDLPYLPNYLSVTSLT